MKMKYWLTSALVFGFAIAAWGQQSAPPPTAPADSGPTLAATMQYIQGKVRCHSPPSSPSSLTSLGLVGHLTAYDKSND